MFVEEKIKMKRTTTIVFVVAKGPHFRVYTGALLKIKVRWDFRWVIESRPRYHSTGNFAV